MNLFETEEERTFRASVSAWMAQHLCGEFEPLRHAGALGASGESAALAKRWEQQLAAGGWTGLGWPRQHGGRELPLAQQVIFHEEYVRCGGPGRLGHIGETLLAPTLMAHGTPELQARFLPGILSGETYWAQGYSEPNAGSDLASVQAARWGYQRLTAGETLEIDGRGRDLVIVRPIRSERGMTETPAELPDALAAYPAEVHEARALEQLPWLDLDARWQRCWCLRRLRRRRKT